MWGTNQKCFNTAKIVSFAARDLTRVLVTAMNSGSDDSRSDTSVDAVTDEKPQNELKNKDCAVVTDQNGYLGRVSERSSQPNPARSSPPTNQPHDAVPLLKRYWGKLFGLSSGR